MRFDRPNEHDKRRPGNGRNVFRETLIIRFVEIYAQ